LEAGYWRAYRDFYRWSAIWRGAQSKATWTHRLRHLAYAAGWKKFEPFWDAIIRLRRVHMLLPALETILAAAGRTALNKDPEPTSETRLAAGSEP
jgi:hypothetical protein